METLSADQNQPSYSDLDMMGLYGEMAFYLLI